MCNHAHGQTAYRQRIAPPRRVRGGLGTAAAALLLLGTLAAGQAWADDLTFWVEAAAAARVGSNNFNADFSGRQQVPPVTAGVTVRPGPSSGN